MECRLCLCSAPPEAFVSIRDGPHSLRLVQLIWTCCRLQVRKDDQLPDMVCRSCVNSLNLLNTFRNDCLQSVKTPSLKSHDCLKVKPEEVVLDDLIWEDESGVNLPPSISSSSNYAEVSKWNPF
ncbi:uncharacterized protein LOC143913578 [Arctopsyche grandis]|uniref:uncharacterized protein LOC143913578 n=1 Tax=Arctopsyche grandis TaxID=121162 RepID=UPI00406D9606